MNRLKDKEESKTSEKPKPIKKGGNKVARSVLNVLNGNFLSKENMVKHLPYLFFLTFILVCYIGYGYFAEKTVKELNRVAKELKELRAEETTIKSNLSKRSKQSQVAAAVAPFGLVESLDPPFKIEVEPGEMALSQE